MQPLEFPLRLQGGGDGSYGFDWLFSNPNNPVKVMEGFYDNSTGNDPYEGRAVTYPSRGVIPPGVKLGLDEWIREDGTRTLADTGCTIPLNIPPRPSRAHTWDAQTQRWIVL